MRLTSRSMSPEDKAIRKAIIDSWCHRHGVERIPAREQRELTEAEIREMGIRPTTLFVPRVRPAAYQERMRSRRGRGR